MKKRISILGCVVFMAVGFAGKAQQDPQFTQFMFDRLSVNPAVAGTKNNICATALLRQQWSGFDGAPKTGLINVHGAIPKISSGLGLSVFFDELGQESSTIARLSYSYHKGLGPGTLGMGFALGMVSKSIGNEWIATQSVSEDDAISSAAQSSSTVDFSLGLYYTTDKAYAGISTTHLSEGDLQDVNVSLSRHYYIMAGYDYAIGGNPNYLLRPNILAKSDAASTQIDINANLLYNNMVWFGVSYRTADAIAPMLGYQKPIGQASMLKVGYSYDVTTSELSNYSNGSHEVMVNYCFRLVKPPSTQKYKNVRFL